ncbi:LIM domain and actin-binding protein 1 isoform X3 [Drosophila willistoni]|uniref:LIM domain and actin-binding protein 1 isoform X3 n=1 Tax=Drosophila willistoni TaxID=7260 RepID=UPI001F074B0F|nr:LIM domain and actin-binding protein 1 isoform X3 [Drosophila willistoni]
MELDEYLNKSSFSKFDALQKRNLIHVRSSDSSKAQKVFSNSDTEKRSNCRQCDKPVYKMEEVVIQFKGDKDIYHKTCLRCKDCSKQIKFDNYQSHEGNLYCNIHFKLLFAPKIVQDEKETKPRKAELIIRESQPVELPPDVARASDKPDLGLEELQQLNVRSRFQVFEKDLTKSQESLPERHTSTAKRNSSILLKLAKLQKQGLQSCIDGGANEVDEYGQIDDTDDYKGDVDHNNGDNDESIEENDDDDNDNDLALVRSRRQTKREIPVGLGEAMNDIRSKFEQGHIMSKEERREERKQEIQNIRSRLFMGKQAKIKEMYQQAVAESEQNITSIGKQADVEIGDAARQIKERFEKGEMFGKSKASQSLETVGNSNLLEDADVFESAITKKSRSIFMELDANAVPHSGHKGGAQEGQIIRSASKLDARSSQELAEGNVVKCDAKPEDIKIATAELSEKFKFFETYRPNEVERRQFRITPPREGVVKMPTPDSDQDDQLNPESKHASQFADNILQKTQTTSTMLNKFREMEKCTKSSHGLKGLKPLKCFTPPPDDRRYSERSDSEEEGDSEENESSNSSDGESDIGKNFGENDDSLKEAQMATRAKQLRAKFEKWQANEIERELNGNHVDVYSQQVSDDSTIESAKTIRDRFENMKNFDSGLQTTPRHQVNRFV